MAVANASARLVTQDVFPCVILMVEQGPSSPAHSRRTPLRVPPSVISDNSNVSDSPSLPESFVTVIQSEPSHTCHAAVERTGIEYVFADPM